MTDENRRSSYERPAPEAGAKSSDRDTDALIAALSEALRAQNLLVTRDNVAAAGAGYLAGYIDGARASQECFDKAVEQAFRR